MDFPQYFRRVLQAGLAGFPLAAAAADAPVLAQQPSPVPRAPVVTAQSHSAGVSSAVLTNLVFDAVSKECKVEPHEKQGKFTFYMTNISDTAVHIISIRGNCSCTKAEMPQSPWIIAPRSTEVLRVTMDSLGRVGKIDKTVTISATNGTAILAVRSDFLAPSPAMGERERNQELAKADRQAVFKGECASCHAEKSRGLMGAALYKEACGICHDSPNRASMVPDLAALNRTTDAAYWRLMTEQGKEKTLMPAFAQAHGGPLSPEQVDSLVAYLVRDFPRDHTPAAHVSHPGGPPQVPPPNTEVKLPAPGAPVRTALPIPDR